MSKSKGKRYSEEQIVGLLKEIDSGLPVVEASRKHGVSEQTLYRWKQKFGGMDLSEVKRMKALEEENLRLKRIIADQAVEINILKEVNSKNW